VVRGHSYKYLVQHRDDGVTAGFAEKLEKRNELVRGGSVQSRGGLVQKQKFFAGHQFGSDGGTAPLA
jgi:hypothetical protein